LIDAEARRALEDALGDGVAFDVPMARHTSLRIGGPADALATPACRDELARLLAICGERSLPHWPVGAGFNCLVADAGIEGVVIKLSRFRTLRGEEPSGAPERSTEEGASGPADERVVFAEAGVTHASITRFCVDRGLSGLEFGAGIPGVVGGWIPMNAGIGSHEMCDVVREIETLEPGEAATRISGGDSLDFTYRALHGLAPGTVVVSARFSVTPEKPEVVRAEVDRLLGLRSGSQPLNVPSCGSVFKNPEGDFAGRLIEAAGLKGAQVGGAQISTVHANFIANTGGATAADVLRLMQRAQEAVEKESGIQLEPEVQRVGRLEDAGEARR
jgi:UDP-N-acetylmuramate dehydrogenase